TQRSQRSAKNAKENKTVRIRSGFLRASSCLRGSLFCFSLRTLRRDFDSPRSSAADVTHLDLALLGGLRGADLGIAIRARAPDAPDDAGQLVVGRAAAQRPTQVGAGSREQAGVELPFGGEPGAGAIAAEGVRHRRDETDLACAVEVAPSLGDLAAIVRVER